MRTLLYISLLVFPLTSHAQDDAIDKLCEHVNQERPRHNSAEYIPGMDVHGNPVVPASPPDSGMKSRILNETIALPINVDLAERYGLELPAGLNIEPNVANVVLFSDGSIGYGNENITPSIKSFCEALSQEIEKNQSNQEEPHGHESANPVLSSDKIIGQYPEN